MRALRKIGLLVGGILLLATAPASAQNAPSRDDIVAKLDKYQSDLELDVADLRKQVTESSRMRGKTEPPPQKRPPIAPDLNKLPAFNVDITFDVDTPIVQPDSYQTVGRIADAMVHSSLLPYTFLIVGHIEANGKLVLTTPTRDLQYFFRNYAWDNAAFPPDDDEALHRVPQEIH